MTRERVNRWIADNLITLIFYACALTAWGMRLEAKVAEKADKAVVEKMADQVDDIHSLMCRDPKWINDSSCRPERKP